MSKFLNLNKLKKEFSNLQIFIKSKAPIRLVFLFYFQGTSNQKIKSKYKNQKSDYLLKTNNLKISTDWFSGKIPFWLWAFDEFSLRNKRDLKALEIGSWEGFSAHFLLDQLPTAHLTCVDTWSWPGHDEIAGTSTKVVEENFDFNMSSFNTRLKKFRGTSIEYFARHNEGEFDFIYVDGGHHVDDVLIDALKCFQMLKNGGIIIFDDYHWKDSSGVMENTAAAINSFLKLKKNKYSIERIYSQLILRKTV